MNKEGQIHETFDLMRLILLGQLVHKTGIAWQITIGVNKWDAMFQCRYGLGFRQVIDVPIELEKADDYIKDKMSDISWEVVKLYHHQQKTYHDFGKLTP